MLSADDACGGWTSTFPPPPPKTVVVSGDPVSCQSCRLSPSAFECSFPGRNFTLNEYCSANAHLNKRPLSFPELQRAARAW